MLPEQRTLADKQRIHLQISIFIGDIKKDSFIFGNELDNMLDNMKQNRLSDAFYELYEHGVNNRYKEYSDKERRSWVWSLQCVRKIACSSLYRDLKYNAQEIVDQSQKFPISLESMLVFFDSSMFSYKLFSYKPDNLPTLFRSMQEHEAKSIVEHYWKSMVVCGRNGSFINDFLSFGDDGVFLILAKNGNNMLTAIKQCAPERSIGYQTIDDLNKPGAPINYKPALAIIVVDDKVDTDEIERHVKVADSYAIPIAAIFIDKASTPCAAEMQHEFLDKWREHYPDSNCEIVHGSIQSAIEKGKESEEGKKIKQLTDALKTDHDKLRNTSKNYFGPAVVPALKHRARLERAAMVVGAITPLAEISGCIIEMFCCFSVLPIYVPSDISNMLAGFYINHYDKHPAQDKNGAEHADREQTYPWSEGYRDGMYSLIGEWAQCFKEARESKREYQKYR